MADWQTIAINALAGVKTGKNIIDILKGSDVTKVNVSVLFQFADQFATAEVAIDMLKTELLKKEAEIQKLKEDMVKMPRCKHCGKPAMHAVSSQKHPVLGALGTRLEKWRCKECGFEEELVPNPDKR